MFGHRAQIGSLLLQHGVINDAQLHQGLTYARDSACKLGEALVTLGLCSEVEIGRVLAQQSELPFVDLKATPPNPNAIRLVPREVAQQYRVIPVRMDGRRLMVAAVDPYDIRLDEVMRKVTGLPILVAAAVEGQIKDALRDYDKLRAGLGQKIQVGQAPGPQNADIRRQPGADLLALADSPAVVQTANALFAEAVRRGATDLQFNPGQGRLEVRARIDGQMTQLGLPEGEQARGLMARVKMLAGIQGIPNNGQPQFGTYTVRVDGREVEWKVSLVTGVDGEVLLLKTTPASTRRLMRLDELGLPGHSAQLLRRSLGSSGGLHLLVGQAGTGVTTTAYALMQALSADDLQVFSIESEVEGRVPGAQQLAASAKNAGSVEDLLTVCLSQAPDALYVSEISSSSMAERLCRAAAQGRTVIAGFHAPTTHQAISRLGDMGLAPHILGSALSGILAQRLVRQNCPHCTARYSPPAELARAMQACFGNTAHCRFQRGTGCARCNQKGTHGRVGVFEYFRVEEDFRYLLAERVPPSVLDEHLRSHGFRSLEWDAFEKAADGVIPPEEILNLGLTLAAEMELRPGLNKNRDPFLGHVPAASGAGEGRWRSGGVQN